MRAHFNSFKVFHQNFACFVNPFSRFRSSLASTSTSTEMMLMKIAYPFPNLIQKEPYLCLNSILSYFKELLWLFPFLYSIHAYDPLNCRITFHSRIFLKLIFCTIACFFFLLWSQGWPWLRGLETMHRSLSSTLASASWHPFCSNYSLNVIPEENVYTPIEGEFIEGLINDICGIEAALWASTRYSVMLWDEGFVLNLSSEKLDQT